MAMNPDTTIRDILAGNQISVPDYQRAYSWDTSKDGKSPKKHVETFLDDLENHIRNGTGSSYYFGHFLFEEGGDRDKFGVIDGQQRLTTIIIFLAALFRRLESIRKLSGPEVIFYENLIKREIGDYKEYRFATVEYDDQFFKEYVIDQTRKDAKGLETVSARRIAEAFRYFSDKLADKDEAYLIDMLKVVQESSCTTHQVRNESDAIQMFIFQNDRGKNPSNLEVIKAKFMFEVHLSGESNRDLIEEIRGRFERIYRSISSIENNVDEDDVLLYTIRVYFDSLRVDEPLERIDRLLSREPIKFIREFTQELEESFGYLVTFFGEDQKRLEIHSLISLGRIGVAFPFILKAYKFGIDKEILAQLCASLESMLVRHRIIATRAEIAARLNYVYQDFKMEKPDIKPIIDRIDWMKTVSAVDNHWWAYWNDKNFRDSLQGNLQKPIARFLLWRYEHSLEKAKHGDGCPHIRLDSDRIERPELEHIAPKTNDDERPRAGYPRYTRGFRAEYLDCWGNYLLISMVHNRFIGNRPFREKRDSYIHLEQQREIQRMTEESDPQWTRDHIDKRKEKIIQFILATF